MLPEDEFTVLHVNQVLMMLFYVDCVDHVERMMLVDRMTMHDWSNE